MAHLSPEQLMETLEGTGKDASAAHVASCGECQRQLADARSVLMALSDTIGIDVPEPTPLFWDHLSARVSDAIANEPPPRRFFAAWLPVLSGRWSRVGALSAVAAAALIAGVMVGSRPAERTAAPPAVAASGDAAVGGDAAAIDDPSFGIVSDLAGEMDVETALAAGLASNGSADHAVLQMTGAELTELERLLQDQASGSGKS